MFKAIVAKTCSGTNFSKCSHLFSI